MPSNGFENYGRTATPSGGLMYYGRGAGWSRNSHPTMSEYEARQTAQKEGYDEKGWRNAALPKGQADDWLKQQKAEWEQVLSKSGVKPGELVAGQHFGDFGVFDAKTKNSLPPGYTPVGYSEGVLRNPHIEVLDTNSRDARVQNQYNSPNAIFIPQVGQTWGKRRFADQLGSQDDVIIARRTGSFGVDQSAPAAPSVFKPSAELERARELARSYQQGAGSGASGDDKPMAFTGDIVKDANALRYEQYRKRFLNDYTGKLKADTRVAAMESSEGYRHALTGLEGFKISKLRDPFTDAITPDENSLYSFLTKDYKTA